ncbi:MAG: NAD(+) diphosphatase [Nocardioidaceae bacterium]
MTQPHLDLAAHAHDRLGARRGDEAWLADRWSDPGTRVLVVSGARLRPVGDAVAWLAPAEAPDGLRVLLGERDGTTWFAVLLEPEATPGDEAAWVGLRAVLPALLAGPAGEAPLVFHALGLAEWHRATRFCPRCGGSLESRSAGHELVCLGCGRAQFPRTDPAVIMAVTFGEPGADDEELLLGRQAVWPPGRFSTLAGFCEPGESLEDAVRREVLEEVGVPVGEVTYFGNQAWPFPSSLMLGFTARALSQGIVLDQDEIEDARWFTRDSMRRAAEAGEVVLPGGVSISRSLVETWFGGPLPGTW